MEIAAFLRQDRVVLDLQAPDKASVLAETARLLAQDVPGLTADVIATALTAREALGSTGFGAGFALPHARMAEVPEYRALFIRLAQPVAFDAADANPVDLIFVLLIPSGSKMPHVSAMASVARRFRDAERLAKLRNAQGVEAVYALLTGC